MRLVLLKVKKCLKLSFRLNIFLLFVFMYISNKAFFIFLSNSSKTPYDCGLYDLEVIFYTG